MYPQMFFSSNIYFCPVSASLSHDRELHNLIYYIFKMLHPCSGPLVWVLGQKLTHFSCCAAFDTTNIIKPPWWTEHRNHSLAPTIYELFKRPPVFIALLDLWYFCCIFFKAQQPGLTRRSKTRRTPSTDRILRIILHSLLDIFEPILGSEQIFLLQRVLTIN